MHSGAIQTPTWLRQMENILGELNEGVIIIDDQFRVVFANDALIRLGCYEPAELQGRTPDAIFPQEDVSYIMRQHELGQRYGRHRNEFYFPRKDGGRIPAIFSRRFIKGPDGKEYGLITITDISLQKHVEAQLRESNALLEKRQLEIEAELSLAERVQQSLAPRSVIWNNLAIEAHYSPARIIGGDFGVILSEGDEFLNLVMCDVSGHGIGSALVANRIYSETLHELERRAGPAILLQQLHKFVYHRLAVDGFCFTMAAVRFSQHGHRATFAGAGHPPAMIVSNGVLRLLGSQHGILGCLAQAALSDSADEVEFSAGDRLVLYTDGLVEVFNRSNEMLAIEGLAKLVRESATQPLPRMKQAILDGVADWSRGPLTDDVSLMIIELRECVGTLTE